MTWARFVQLFNEKYLSEAIRTEKVHEFLNLRQGKMSVAEYAMKFEELARFSPFMVPTEEARKAKFMHGRKTEIIKYVDSGIVGPLPYAEVVQWAIKVES